MFFEITKDQNYIDTYYTLDEQDLERFKELSQTPNILPNKSTQHFNAVSLSIEGYQISRAVDYYLRHIDYYKDTHPKKAIAETQKLITLLDHDKESFSILAATQQHKILKYILDLPMRVPEETLVRFFSQVNSFPEFDLERYEKEKEFMIEIKKHKVFETLQSLDPNDYNFQDKIKEAALELINLKTSIWGIKPPAIIFKNLSKAQAQMDKGILYLGTQKNSQLWDVKKLIGLISHEIDHHIHHTMKKKISIIPKTKNNKNAYNYVDMLKWVYKSHNRNEKSLFC